MYFTRHGERLDKTDPKWLEKTKCPPDDSPLADKGRLQAVELAQTLKTEKIDHIFCSPFQRCVETAHIIAMELHMLVKVEPGICEVLHTFPPGCMTLNELHRKFHTVDTSYRHALVPGRAENHEIDCFPRVKIAVTRIREKYKGTLLFVGHAASVAGMTKAFVKKPHFVSLCTLTKIEQNSEKPGKWKTVYVGEKGHLSDRKHLRAHKRMNPQIRRAARVLGIMG